MGVAQDRSLETGSGEAGEAVWWRAGGDSAEDSAREIRTARIRVADIAAGEVRSPQ